MRLFGGICFSCVVAGEFSPTGIDLDVDLAQTMITETGFVAVVSTVVKLAQVQHTGLPWIIVLEHFFIKCRSVP